MGGRQQWLDSSHDRTQAANGADTQQDDNDNCRVSRTVATDGDDDDRTMIMLLTGRRRRGLGWGEGCVHHFVNFLI